MSRTNHQQINYIFFLEYFHPYLQKMIVEENVNSAEILSNFMVKPELYDSIMDVMQCIVTSFVLIGTDESKGREQTVPTLLANNVVLFAHIYNMLVIHKIVGLFWTCSKMLVNILVIWYVTR